MERDWITRDGGGGTGMGEQSGEDREEEDEGGNIGQTVKIKGHLSANMEPNTLEAS